PAARPHVGCHICVALSGTPPMPWDTRRRGGRYFTGSRRFHGRAVRECLGYGPITGAAAATDVARQLPPARTRPMTPVPPFRPYSCLALILRRSSRRGG